MKTTAFVAAALAGAAVADSWASWDPSTSTTTTTASWGPDSASWDPKHKHKHTTFSTSTTTAGEWDPWTTTTTTTSSTGQWDPWTTTTTTTASDEFDAATTTTVTSWGAWDPWSSTCTATVTLTAAATTTTTTTTVTVTSTWGASATDAWDDPGMCGVSTYTSTGAPTWSPEAPWTSYSTVYVSAIPSTTSSAWVSPSASSSSSDDWAWSSSSYSASASASASWSAPSSSSSPSGGSAPISPSGSQWAMTYSPYTSSGGCTDQGTIASDIANIASKGFTSVRVYSTDCNTLEFVGQACRDNGLKLILGIFISDTGISGAAQQVTDILAWAQWDIVELIVVGNEATFNGYCSAGELAGFIGSVKSQCSGAGYTGPVTTTEPLSTWQSVGTTFCSAVDCVSANLYAFFNAQTTADQAGDFIQSEITILEGICSGKDVYVMETGWPTAGDCNGVACPGVSEQATAIKGIQATSGAKVVFFSYEDDAWKAPGQFGVEQHWGCADVFSGGSNTSSGW